MKFFRLLLLLLLPLFLTSCEEQLPAGKKKTKKIKPSVDTDRLKSKAEEALKYCKLHGLESSNSNALKRVVVFHSWEVIPDDEPYPSGTPEGWGCPAISDKDFLKIDAWLQNKKKVLMWIYNEKLFNL
jgi:hypothetical protein